MSYATPDDVTALFRDLDLTKSNTAVDAAKIQSWLDSTDNMINARLSKYYTLNPALNVTDNPLSWSILKMIESFYVAGIVDDILNSYSDGDKKPMWEKRAAAMLDMYAPLECAKDCGPASVLPDAPYLNTPTLRGAFRASNTTTAPIFVKGANNW